MLSVIHSLYYIYGFLLCARHGLGSEDIAVKTQAQFLICAHVSQSGKEYTHKIIYTVVQMQLSTINT